MQNQLKQLITQKDEIEKQIATLSDQIALIDEVKDFSKGVVDHQGFPRADIDFGQLSNYRNLKRRKAQLNNDHLALMKEIQKKLFSLHETFKKENPQQVNQTFQPKNTPNVFKKSIKTTQAQSKPQYKIDYLTPFAKLTLVFQHSPARLSGLQANDLVSEFGQINVYTMDWIKQIPSAVKEGQPILVKILRLTEEQPSQQKKIFTLKDQNNYQKHQITLIPSKWDGKGLLGCKIDPIS